MRTVAIEVRRQDGWETLTFEDIEELRVVGGQDDQGLTLTLLGIRSDQPNVVEPGVVDIADRHADLIDNAIPRTEDGDVLPAGRRG